MNYFGWGICAVNSCIYLYERTKIGRNCQKRKRHEKKRKKETTRLRSNIIGVVFTIHLVIF